MKYISVNDEAIPALGFGTFQMSGDNCRESVHDALDIGYRHIDTARMYGNETQVGQGIRDSGVDRSELFLTSKVWYDDLHEDEVIRETENSLRELNTDYLDLLLIHWPNEQIPLAETMKAMEKLQDQGKIRHCGVSNFTVALMKQVEKTGTLIITNQVEYHPLLSQDKLLAYIRKKSNLFLTAYCPLAKGELVNEPVLRDIGNQYGKTPSQVALRWLVEQQDVAAIPKASSHRHRVSNFDIFDFDLSDEDRQAVAELPKNRRKINPSFAPQWD